MLCAAVLTVGEHLIKHRFYANYMQRTECWGGVRDRVRGSCSKCFDYAS